MTEQRRASAIQGFQIAFLAFAAVLLTAPFDKYVASTWPWARDLELDLGRPLIFVVAAALLVLIGPLRRHCAALLQPRIAPGTRHQVLIALVILVVADLGVFGAFALWNWSRGGEPALARAMGEQVTHAAQMASALSTHGIVMFVFIGACIGPIVEELVFRGVLFATWQRAWGWIASSFATAVVFGLFHGAFWPQFLGSLVFVCLLRKTGALRASIYMHGASNLLLWYPIVGQFMLHAGRSTGELHLWTPHLVCLALTAILLPWYMWSARDARLPR
jgi:membrane protease YdiL (CAAX protease family)